MEEEMRKCYEDYLQNNSQLVELILRENNRENNCLLFDDSLIDREHRRQQPIQLSNTLRRRSITPPPEYCRLDSTSLNHLQAMNQGSTSTILSSISSGSSTSTGFSSMTSASIESGGGSSSSASSSMFRAHRFIPNIISHQAQKMAQAFELKKFRSNNSQKKENSNSLHSHGSDSSTMLKDKLLKEKIPILFGLIGSGPIGTVSSYESGLKRSESANNIHKINSNVLLPDDCYDVLLNSNPTKKIISKHRKHSINDELTSINQID
ncbi:hypothetical protein QR98_0039420 [Sarcoptes scabiei]|uniref:Uncharacterized protein n=1 Tax=Sarcoptes scabiei TaxID=52283 RepID=A0A132A3A1_SARSC|nr:hypothetical protein QR98_0039420 [Sarcoptes scabiei]